MGRITRFIGGQTVTDNGVQEERTFQRVSAFPGSPEDGVIYITNSTIQNAFQITNYELTSSGSLGAAATSFNVRVTGDEGARFTIVGANGASNVGQRTIDSSGTDEFSVSVSQNPTGEAARNPSALLVPSPESGDVGETIFAEEFVATNPIVVTQAAGLLSRNVTASPTSGTAEVAAFFDDITFTWLGGGQGSVSVSGQNPAGSSSFTTVGRITGNSPFFDLNVQADGTYDGIGSPALNSGGNIDMRMSTATADIPGNPNSYNVTLRVSLPETPTHGAGSASCTITYTQ